MVAGFALLTIILLLVPYFAGLLIPNPNGNITRTYTNGFVVLWALFYPVSMLFILKQKSLTSLCYAYSVLVVIVILAGLACWIFVYRPQKNGLKKPHLALKKTEIVYLGIFIAIVAFQIYKTLFYAYSDGDDAFYIATAQSADVSDKMYLIEPYLGLGLFFEDVNVRYVFAPFPMWVAYLARITHLNVAIVSHSCLPIFLICVTYVIYDEIAQMLFDKNKEKRFMFLSLIAIIIMFSNVSTSTAETFLLTRARQGKEALANIVLPFAFLKFYEITKSLNEDNKIKTNDVVMLFLVSTSAASMSVFGNVLYGISVAVFGIILLIKKNKFINVLKIAITVLPNMLVVLLYFMKR